MDGEDEGKQLREEQEERSRTTRLIRTKIYSHITIATDPDNVQFVFAAVKHTILSSIIHCIIPYSACR